VDELCTVEMFLQMWKLLSLCISPQGGAVHTTQKNNNPETQNLHAFLREFPQHVKTGQQIDMQK